MIFDKLSSLIGIDVLFSKNYKLGGNQRMKFIKDYGVFLISLFVALFFLGLLRGLLKKVPVVDGIVEKAEEVAGLE